jgi:hypothetical protein
MVARPWAPHDPLKGIRSQRTRNLINVCPGILLFHQMQLVGTDFFHAELIRRVSTARIWRAVLMALVAGLAAINGADAFVLACRRPHRQAQRGWPPA